MPVATTPATIATYFLYQALPKPLPATVPPTTTATPAAAPTHRCVAVTTSTTATLLLLYSPLL